MEEIKNLPSISEEKIKEDLNLMIDEFYKEHGILPSRIRVLLQSFKSTIK